MQRIHTKLIGLILLVALAPWCDAAAKTYTAQTVPNVHLRDKNAYVSDPDSLMSASARARADAILKALDDSTTVETAIVVVNDIGNADIYDFALALGRHWGVGKRDKNNGVVVIFAMDQKQVRIQTGSGVEGVLPDLAAKRLIDEKVIPRMKTGDLDNAVVDLSSALMNVFTDPEAAAELRSERDDGLDMKGMARALFFFCCIVGLVSVALLLWHCWQMRKLNTYRRALFCRENRWLYIILAVISLGLGLPAMIIYLWMGHYYRNHSRKCDVCGTRMKKLSEDADNAYLTQAQDMEEKLDSVDYDVWLCPKCGTTEIFPFVKSYSRYKVCPRCHSRTLGLLYDRVERRPTQVTDGVGVKVYECRHCGLRHEERYSIPKQQAAVFIGGIGGGGRGGGGGGFSGGSWGGGGFSGGGASGSW